jgi:HAD superfamily hydrolase (TIGR01490 family)
MSYVAFFDLDHTILKINSGEALLRRAYKNRLLSTGKLIRVYCLFVFYKAHLTDPLTIIEKISGWLTESTVDEIEMLCNEIVVKDLIPAIRPEIITRIKRHKAEGARVVILSSAITSICTPLAIYLGMDLVIGSELEIINRKYTGRTVNGFCFRDEKLNRMKQYLQANNLTLQNSWYYGDSTDDLPVLKSVGHAVCVAPGRKLKKIARENRWMVIEGKDWVS